MRVVALAGGVGAARFLKGLSLTADRSGVTVIGNTADDLVLYGLHISPDLDTVMYGLAGLEGEHGWGLRHDTTHALEQMRAYGLEGWFTLGDRDLGTHLARTGWLSEGKPLSWVTDRLRRALGVPERIIPMSDQVVRTLVTTGTGAVREFQDYFVRHGHSEALRAVEFTGAADALPAPGVLPAIAEADVIIICPSNPVVSIGPILSIPGIREALAGRRDRVVAISPLVEGRALKGPAAEMMSLLGVAASASGVASAYRDICGTMVIDHRDEEEGTAIAAMGMGVSVTDTIMTSPEAASSLAKVALSA